MSNMTILKALERMGYKGRMTGHGFRGLASTILHEQGYNHEHIELQLAHAPRNAVSAAYNHALYLEPRARMMQDWADFLERTQRAAQGVAVLRNSGIGISQFGRQKTRDALQSNPGWGPISIPRRTSSRRRTIHSSSLAAEFPAGLYLACNPLLDLGFNPADSPGSKRHRPWELPFGDSLIDRAA